MSHANKNQISKMSSFMEKNPELAKSYNNLNSCGRITQRQQWEQLARSLNMIGPPTKSVAEWKRLWTLRKYSAKKKLTHSKNSIKKTGGGPFDLKPLDDNEEAIINAWGMEASVTGIVGGVSFGSGTEENNASQDLDKLLDDLTRSPDREIENVLQDTSHKNSSTPKKSSPKDKVDDVLKRQLNLQENFFTKQLEAQNTANDTLAEIRDALRELVDVQNRETQITTALKKEELEIRKRELEVAQMANELRRMELKDK